VGSRWVDRLEARERGGGDEDACAAAGSRCAFEGDALDRREALVLGGRLELA
jgi:hypothetical protein